MIAAVVLAAGDASRYGSPKQRVLLPAVLARLAETNVSEVVVVAGAHALDGVDLGRARVVHCPDWDRGPGASLRCGLQALGQDVDAALVVLADGPGLDPRAVDRVASRLGDGPVLAASYDGSRGHPVLLERSAWSTVPDAGARGLEAVLVECGDLDPPGDVDYPDSRLTTQVSSGGPRLKNGGATMSTTDAAISDPAQLTGDYTFDVAHSTFGFVARHAMVTKVRGTFGEFEGTAHLDFTDPAKSTVNVTIQATSIDTGHPDRDAHLRSNDFFAMDEYPEITFASTAIEAIDAEHYRVTGDLTIRAETRSVTFEAERNGPVVDPWGNTRVGFDGSFTVNRKDWGVNWNMALEAGGVVVSEKVTLEFDVSATKNAS